MATSTIGPPVTLVPGDGIQTQVTEAARRIVEATDARSTGKRPRPEREVFKKGTSLGRPGENDRVSVPYPGDVGGLLETPWASARRARTSRPEAVRDLRERPAGPRVPGVKTPYSGRGIDLVMVRENVEDLYAGIEYMQTPGVVEALKLISVAGCEKIARFAFDTHGASTARW